jgi:hypothetical protein
MKAPMAGFNLCINPCALVIPWSWWQVDELFVDATHMRMLGKHISRRSDLKDDMLWGDFGTFAKKDDMW